MTKDAAPEARGEAYYRLTKVEFSVIAKKLAAQFSTRLAFSGVGSSTKEPWKEARFTDWERANFTLLQLWYYHLEEREQKMEHVGLLLDLLESPEIGYGKSLALYQITEAIYHGLPHNSAKIPSKDGVMKRLDALVQDTRQPLDLRQQLVTILFKYGDADKYFDRIIEMSSATVSVVGKGEVLRTCAPPGLATRLTGKNRRRYVRLCFEYIQEMDDGISGHGYFLAGSIGSFVGVKPVRDGQSSFAPDQKLPKYQDANGLNKSFFQDAVNNALAWWAENKKNY